MEELADSSGSTSRQERRRLRWATDFHIYGNLVEHRDCEGTVASAALTLALGEASQPEPLPGDEIVIIDRTGQGPRISY